MPREKIMQLKIQTSKLQEMVTKSIKGASNNKMIPLTSLMEIELKDKTLTLRTTDAANTLSIIAKDIDGEDFHTVVPSEMFSKLVGKITTANITLTVGANSLNVKGNGEYQIELPLDDEGNSVKFPSQPNILVIAQINTFLSNPAGLFGHLAHAVAGGGVS